MKNPYDVVIIGSGMGGLVSSIILAKEGLKVCVLEKNNQYGGNLQTFVRDKVIFDTGIHYIGGLEEGQNLYQYFKYLGIIDDLRLKRMDKNAYDYITFDGDPNQYPHAQGYDNFIEQLCVFFPEERDAIQKYCDKIQQVCDSFPMYNVEEGAPYNQDILSIKAKDFIDGLTENEDLKLVLAGSNSLYGGNGEKTPLYVHALSVNSYIQSAWRCIQGGSQITKLLVRQLRKYGGEIYKRQEVSEFIFDKDQLIGVKTQKDQFYYGKQFISNIDLNATIKMVGENRFRKSFKKRIERLKVTPSSFSIYIAFKPKSFPYLNHNYYHFKNKNIVWEGTKHDPKKWPESYMVSMGAYTENQEYAESMSVMTYMHFSEVEQWANTKNTVAHKDERGAEYEAFKEKHIELLLVELEKKFPNIRACILSIHASTPLSYRDYIGGQYGNMYGFEKDAENAMKTFISARTKVPNLFLTGQSVNMHGILGVTIGGFATCSEILGKEYLINKVKEEVNEPVQS